METVPIFPKLKCWPPGARVTCAGSDEGCAVRRTQDVSVHKWYRLVGLLWGYWLLLLHDRGRKGVGKGRGGGAHDKGWGGAQRGGAEYAMREDCMGSSWVGDGNSIASPHTPAATTCNASKFHS